MQHNTKTNSRKKFLLWGTAALASVTALRFLFGRQKPAEAPAGETVTMLTQDGQLVEIDKEFLANNGHSISNEDLQQWIKK